LDGGDSAVGTGRANFDVVDYGRPVVVGGWSRVATGVRSHVVAGGWSRVVSGGGLCLAMILDCTTGDRAMILGASGGAFCKSKGVFDLDKVCTVSDEVSFSAINLKRQLLPTAGIGGNIQIKSK
jgi:hypothetical protein